MLDFENAIDKEDIAREFQIDASALEGCTILFAAYKSEAYEGSALVVFMKDGKLYEVHGSHCSCYGLENQWDPEETSMEALKIRDFSYYGFNGGAEAVLLDLVFEQEVLNE